jgi:hypothetical protein
VPETRVSRTGRGRRLLFRHDHGLQALVNAEGLLSDFDVNIRGEGGFIVGPGSTHETVEVLPSPFASMNSLGVRSSSSNA